MNSFLPACRSFYIRSSSSFSFSIPFVMLVFLCFLGDVVGLKTAETFASAAAEFVGLSLLASGASQLLLVVFSLMIPSFFFDLVVLLTVPLSFFELARVVSLERSYYSLGVLGEVEGSINSSLSLIKGVDDNEVARRELLRRYSRFCCY